MNGLETEVCKKCGNKFDYDSDAAVSSVMCPSCIFDTAIKNAKAQGFQEGQKSKLTADIIHEIEIPAFNEGWEKGISAVEKELKFLTTYNPDIGGGAWRRKDVKEAIEEARASSPSGSDEPKVAAARKRGKP